MTDPVQGISPAGSNLGVRVCGLFFRYSCTRKCVGMSITLIPLKMSANTSELSFCARITPIRAPSTLGTAMDPATKRSTLLSRRNLEAPTVPATLREARLAPLAAIWLSERSPVREGLIICAPPHPVFSGEW